MLWQHTLFAPTNQAFELIKDGEISLPNILLYHLSDKAYDYSELCNKDTVKSLYKSPGLGNSAQFLRVSVTNSNSLHLADRHLYLHSELETWNNIQQMDGDDSIDQGPIVLINQARISLPNLISRSGSIVHGVDKIIEPPKFTIIDEIKTRSFHFSYLIKAWSSTGVDAYIRDGNSLTLFAPHDKAWKDLPTETLEWLFSDEGRGHLKVIVLYQVANTVFYTSEIYSNPAKECHQEITLQSLLHSPKFQLHAQEKKRLVGGTTGSRSNCIIDLIWGLLSDKSDIDSLDEMGYQHDISSAYYSDDDDGTKPYPSIPRDVVINGNARIMEGLDNWIAENGVIHVVDKILMPPRDEDCKGMTDEECSAWQIMWDVDNISEETIVDDEQDWWDDVTLFDMEETLLEEET
ncbi:hypothetical protein BGZ76_003567 [Entomortierella beljakovae]|nr:hypothetical protein BGZ76_003567 [Entomortierella beljakovae]